MIKIVFIFRNRYLENTLKNKIKSNFIPGVKFEFEEIRFATENEEPLLVFIQVKTIKDIDFAESIRKRIRNVIIVIVCKNDFLVFEGLKILPLQFIRLSKLDEDFESMKEGLNVYLKNMDRTITLKISDGIIRLNQNTIMYIEANNNYLTIHGTNGIYKSPTKMVSLLKRINNPNIIRVHNYYSVNKEFVLEMLNNKLLLKDGQEIPIGRRFIKEFKKEFLDFSLKERLN